MFVAVSLYPHKADISYVEKFTYGGMNRIASTDTKPFDYLGDIAQELVTLTGMKARAIFYGMPYSPPFEFDIDRLCKFYDSNGNLIIELLPKGEELESIISKTNSLLTQCRQNDIIIVNSSDYILLDIPKGNVIVNIDCKADISAECVIVKELMLLELSGGDVVAFIRKYLDCGVKYVVIIKENVCIFTDGAHIVNVSRINLPLALASMTANINVYTHDIVFEAIKNSNL